MENKTVGNREAPKPHTETRGSAKAFRKASQNAVGRLVQAAALCADASRMANGDLVAEYFAELGEQRMELAAQLCVMALGRELYEGELQILEDAEMTVPSIACGSDYWIVRSVFDFEAETQDLIGEVIEQCGQLLSLSQLADLYEQFVESRNQMELLLAATKGQACS